MANIINSRSKLRQRNNGRSYRSVVVVENDPEGTVDTVEVKLAPNGDITPQPGTMILQEKNTNKNGQTRYVFACLVFEGGNPDGKAFSFTATMRDSAGKQIGESSTTQVTAQDNDGINVATPVLKKKSDELFLLRVVVRGDNKDQVKGVTASLFPQDGGSEAEPAEYELGQTDSNEKRNVWKNTEITFLEPDNVVDMQYLCVVELTDGEGKVLDRLDFYITGVE